MADRVPFTFGIPLIARDAARDWARVESLFALTLSSLLAQTDLDFRVVVAGHDRPSVWPGDGRVSFVRADWPPRAPEARNCDAGRKKHAIRDLVLARGGGILMFVDADDWVDIRLVEAARAEIRPEHVGAAVVAGYAVDMRTLKLAALPQPALHDGGFDSVCGSSTMVRLRPDHPDALRRDPYALLHEHHRFRAVAGDHGLPVARLPVSGCYVVNTSENHSELHGPFADWRREFCERLNAVGTPLDEATAAGFGLTLPGVRRVSRQLDTPAVLAGSNASAGGPLDLA